MIYLIMFMFVVVFIEMFIALKIIQGAQTVIQLSAKSMDVMKSKEMTDLEKEKFMRTNSLVMMRTTIKFIAKFSLIFIVIYLINFAIEAISAPLAHDVMEGFLSIYYMVLLTIVGATYVWVRNVISSKL